MNEPEIPFHKCSPEAMSRMVEGLIADGAAKDREIERLTRELKIQTAVNDLAYRPHRLLVESRDALQKRFDALEAENVKALTNNWVAECHRLRAGLKLIATDEHRLMNVTARQTAQSILDGASLYTLTSRTSTPTPAGSLIAAATWRSEAHVRRSDEPLIPNQSKPPQKD